MENEILLPVSSLKKNPAENYLNSLGSPRSMVTVANCSKNIALMLGQQDYSKADWSKLRRTHWLKVHNSLKSRGCSGATVNLYLTVFKAVAREAWSLDLLSQSVYLKYIMSVFQRAEVFLWKSAVFCWSPVITEQQKVIVTGQFLRWCSAVVLDARRLSRSNMKIGIAARGLLLLSVKETKRGRCFCRLTWTKSLMNGCITAGCLKEFSFQGWELVRTKRCLFLNRWIPHRFTESFSSAVMMRD